MGIESATGKRVVKFSLLKASKQFYLLGSKRQVLKTILRCNAQLFSVKLNSILTIHILLFFRQIKESQLNLQLFPSVSCLREYSVPCTTFSEAAQALHVHPDALIP